MLGIQKLQEGEEIPIAILETAIAVVVIGTFLLELRILHRKHRHAGSRHSHPRFGWFDLAAGCLLIFEAFHGAHTKPGYLRPAFLSGMATLLLGLFHARIHGFRHRRRYLKIDQSGVECRTAPLRKFRVDWNEIASVEVTADRASFLHNSGRRDAVVLRGLLNAPEVRQAIEAHVPERLRTV